jgi:hypothetical protein
MHASLRYRIRGLSSGAFFVALIGFAVAACDGTSNSHSDAGLVTVSGGSGGLGAHSSGAGGMLVAGAGQGGAGAGRSDAGSTDASGGAVFDASDSSLSDAGQNCGCVGQTIAWGVAGPTMQLPLGVLSPCATFTPKSTDTDAQASCSVDVSQCSGGIGAGVIEKAVQLPGVQAALRLAPVFLGASAMGGAFRLSVGDKMIGVGQQCAADAGDCIPIPSDVLVLRALLMQLRKEQQHKGPCSEVFMHRDAQ